MSNAQPRSRTFFFPPLQTCSEAGSTVAISPLTTGALKERVPGIILTQRVGGTTMSASHLPRHAALSCGEAKTI